MRLTWLADVLRAAGVQVVEVDGWRTRGREDIPCSVKAVS